MGESQRTTTTALCQVKSSTNTPLIHEAKQVHAKKRRNVCSPGNRSGWLGLACEDLFLTQVLFWFGLELPRKGIAKGDGICDARVKVQPLNIRGLRLRDTAKVRPLRWQRFLYLLTLEVANQGKFCARHFVKKFLAGV